MTKFFTNNFISTNLYKKNSSNSEIVSQMIYGDAFSVINKTSNLWKIKIKEDGYIGYVEKKKYISYVKPTHKICTLSANFFANPIKGRIVGKLTYGSKIKLEKKKLNLVKFQNKWIEKKNLKPLNYKYSNIFFKINNFKNVKYKWGGKTFNGIDCSALVQIFFNFNNKFLPRDTREQIKFLKKNIKLKNIKKNDIIYWKGHVAVALSKTKLIHAYGPVKKTIIMNIKTAIKLIKKTAKLNIISIKRL